MGKIVIGRVYRHRSNPNVGYAKVLEIIAPKTGVNTHDYKIVRVEWCQDSAFTFGLIKYFKQSDLILGQP